ncbi:MAG: helix-turn-helix transcriptional regulator [Rhodospirillaceae bacterium]|jgi:ArsR family transcriptional regulator, virulence genes transcriptional regulator|nr:helix-turn-helix transcriptional regulator [Rhodospirillaceae bacterium]MBT5243432.1 helix-turn-helix transcriptional regulator [Rhodospirillaceae bacterium]MBT5563437.1 helix-turn-helix transcriptional regulator [Rhodospirillaceae bacterium]MBT6241112.1 helix-turn-helix transcriptional regulator [Rhodospirillaceae bacterium]MBT7137611.1 helix-turn-helix transcriptional regulator [Rhodospirillaceae bacterium]
MFMNRLATEETASMEMAGHIEASALMKAMSNEARLMILCRLFDDEKSVTELEQMIGLSQSAISQHLAILRENQLVNTKRDGQSIKYSLAGAKPRAIIEVLHRLYAKCP